MSWSTAVLLALVGIYTLVAAVSDFRTRRLPNWLTVPAFALAIVFHLATGGWHGLLSSLGGFATGFGILFVLWLIGGSGAGDVKFMGALGAWLGTKLTLYVFFVSTGMVAVATVGILIWQLLTHGMSHVRKRHLSGLHSQKLPKSKAAADEAEARWRERRRVMPYALPVALGTWIVLAWKFVLTHPPIAP